MKKLTFALLLGVLLISCSEKSIENHIINNENAFKKVIVQFYPSFLEPSIMILDMQDSTIIFQRFGFKTRYKITEDDSENKLDPTISIDSTFAIPSIKCLLTKNDYIDLRNNFHFKDDDFIDRYNFDVCDGKANTIFFVLENGNMIDIDLSNSYTAIQKRFLKKTINICLRQKINKSTREYLTKLDEYY